MLGATKQNLVTRALMLPGFVYPCWPPLISHESVSKTTNNDDSKITRVIQKCWTVQNVNFCVYTMQCHVKMFVMTGYVGDWERIVFRLIHTFIIFRLVFYKYSSNSDKYLQRFNLQTEEISLGKRNQMNQACSLFNDAQHHELNIY